MTKAKLIKKGEVVERQQQKTAQKAQKQTVKQTVDNWIEKQNAKRLDPRAAFAALFAQPQAQ